MTVNYKIPTEITKNYYFNESFSIAGIYTCLGFQYFLKI